MCATPKNGGVAYLKKEIASGRVVPAIVGSACNSVNLEPCCCQRGCGFQRGSEVSGVTHTGTNLAEAEKDHYMFQVLPNRCCIYEMSNVVLVSNRSKFIILLVVYIGV